MINQIFTIFCALFLAQALVIHAKPEPNNLQASQVRGIADEAEANYKTLMAAIDQAVDDANVFLNAALQVVNETVIGLEFKGHDAIILAMDPINDRIKALIAQADILGYNTTQCGNYIDDLTDLPNNVNNDMVECMTDELYKATDYADDVLGTIQEIEQEMANYTNKIKDCEGNILTEITCLTLLSAEMTTDSVKIPIKIAADVSRTVALIGKLMTPVGLCYTESFTQIPIQGAEIVENFALCVGILQN